jgi:hypothetical protein
MIRRIEQLEAAAVSVKNTITLKKFWADDCTIDQLPDLSACIVHAGSHYERITPSTQYFSNIKQGFIKRVDGNYSRAERVKPLVS